MLKTWGGLQWPSPCFHPYFWSMFARTPFLRGGVKNNNNFFIKTKAFFFRPRNIFVRELFWQCSISLRYNRLGCWHGAGLMSYFTARSSTGPQDLASHQMNENCWSIFSCFACGETSCCRCDCASIEGRNSNLNARGLPRRGLRAARCVRELATASRCGAAAAALRLPCLIKPINGTSWIFVERWGSKKNR